jgi:signal transduction histidine kinase
MLDMGNTESRKGGQALESPPNPDLPPAIRAALLDPVFWRQILEPYAQAVHLAVALTDTHGRLLGACINPQPLWSLVRAQQPAPPDECPFCLLPFTPCTSVRDALRTRAVVTTQDRLGLTHFAVPLVLGEQPLGALIAGQVFDQYPDWWRLKLEQIANKFALLQGTGWQTVRQQRPISRAVLRTYGDLLAVVGNNFLLTRYHMLREADRLAEMQRAHQQLQESQAEFARSNAELQQFAYVTSHDLQEPLRMVTSYLQLLARRYQGQLDAQAQEFIGYAVEGGQRMKALIDDLLIYSRVGSQEKPLTPTDSETILQQTLQILQIQIAESGAIVTFDPLPTVRADRTQLGMLWQNLLSNAVKFHGPEPPRIHVSARRQGAEWVFSVRDNGIGLDPKQAERIFVVFQRLHTRSEYPGTGIGLAICKKIVERHGGHIWVESVPGQGATFFFTLPAGTD